MLTGAQALACIGVLVQGSCLCAVLEVGPDKPYRTLSEAILASSQGDTIVVDPGVYQASVGFKHGCTLTGTGLGKTVLVPSPFGPGSYPVSPGDGTLIRGLWLCGGWRAGVQGSPGFTSRLEDCVIWGNGTGVVCDGPGNRMFITNCIICGNDEGVASLAGASALLLNTVVYGNEQSFGGELANISATYSCIEGGWPGEGNIDADPVLANPVECRIGELVDRPQTYSRWPDLRLRAGSPCIDAGLNDPDLPETDIAGVQRIMFGGKSLTVDMGPYEYYINDLKPGPTPDQTTLTWSSLSERSYSIFWCDDLLTWHLADGAILSAGDMTTSWVDDGSKTGIPPFLAPRRFYRILENPQNDLHSTRHSKDW